MNEKVLKYEAETSRNGADCSVWPREPDGYRLRYAAAAVLL